MKGGGLEGIFGMLTCILTKGDKEKGGQRWFTPMFLIFGLWAVGRYQ